MLSRFMKVLIVSASIGSGHNQAARALATEIEKLYPLGSVKIVDFMAEDVSYANTLLKETYLKVINIFPNIYDYLYRWTQAGRQGSKVQNLLARLMQRHMAKLVKQYQPDLIIATHPFPCGAAAFLKETGKMRAMLAAVVTDFAVHRMWVNKQVDMYFVATQEMRKGLIQQGFKPEQVFATGIPIKDKFAQAISGELMLRDLNLDISRPTILVMGGGLGLGGVEEALRSLNAVNYNSNIVVVAGANDSLKEILMNYEASPNHLLRILGFSDRIPELMAATALLITKPGALTISEALASKLPIIFYQSIPGQEEENARYIVNQGAALWVKSADELNGAVSAILADQNRLTKMRSIAGKLGRPDAAVSAATIIKELWTAREYSMGGRTCI